MESVNYVTVRCHLNSGTSIDISYESVEEAEEVAKALAEAIGNERPHWHLIDTTLIFTGAVSAIEVL